MFFMFLCKTEWIYSLSTHGTFWKPGVESRERNLVVQVGGNSLGHLDLDLCGRSHPVVSPKFQTRLRSSCRCFRYLRWQKGEVYFLLLKLSKFKARVFFFLPWMLVLLHGE